MPVRRQTLEEWFLVHQLRSIGRHHAHVPADVRVDVTRIVGAYAEAGAKAPLTAVVVRAVALLARRHPEINRVVLPAAPWSLDGGLRVVDFEGAHVNVPVMMTHQGVRHLSAVVVRDADRLSVDGIRARLREARERDVASLPIGCLFIANENTFANRLRLRARHFAAYHVPALYEKHGGGLSVSSLVRPAPAGVTVRIPSFGPTALTFCPGTVEAQAGGRHVLSMGVGYDHFAFGGRDCIRYLEGLGEILSGGDLAPFLPAVPAPPSRAVQREAPGVG